MKALGRKAVRKQFEIIVEIGSLGIFYNVVIPGYAIYRDCNSGILEMLGEFLVFFVGAVCGHIAYVDHKIKRLVFCNFFY